MQDANSVPSFHDFYPDDQDMTVAELIEVLKTFPQRSLVSFQVEAGALQPYVLLASAVDFDPRFNITDIIFEKI